MVLQVLSKVTIANQMQIRLATPADDKDIQQLVLSVFDEFVGVDFNDSGRQTFYKFMSLENMKQRSLTCTRLVAEAPSQALAGVLEAREMSHVALFFVHKDFQGQGIGRQLLAKFITLAKESDPQLKAITVHSSPYALPVYKALGFEATGPEVKKNGIHSIPMSLEVWLEIAQQGVRYFQPQLGVGFEISHSFISVLTDFRSQQFSSLRGVPPNTNDIFQFCILLPLGLWMLMSLSCWQHKFVLVDHWQHAFLGATQSTISAAAQNGAFIWHKKAPCTTCLKSLSQGSTESFYIFLPTPNISQNLNHQSFKSRILVEAADKIYLYLYNIHKSHDGLVAQW